MTNFRKTLLAAGIGLALGVSAEAWAEPTTANDNSDGSTNVAVDASSATASQGLTNAAANNHSESTATDNSDNSANAYGGTVANANHDSTSTATNSSDNSYVSAGGNQAAAANRGSTATATDNSDRSSNSHNIDNSDNSSAYAEPYGAAANNGSTATTDNSDRSDNSSAYAESYGAAANNGGTASIDNSDHSSATGGGDVAYANNYGDATIDKSVNEVSAQVAYGDHDVANHDGTVNFSNTEVNLSAEVSTVTVIQTGVALAGTPGFDESNSINNAVNGAAGITQLVQNQGAGALVQQSANVFGTVNVTR